MLKQVFFVVGVLMGVLHASAQLCQGSLGDPLINITFGAGANPGPPLAAAATGYQYVAGDCPNDGYYTVRSNTTSCFGSSWYSLSTDHTGDANGYFMLVNASIQPSAFYLDTVRGLCGGSTYEFAAWIMNVILPSACNSNAIQPNLTFTIERTDGSVLQTYNSGNIAATNSPLWKQYGFFFTTPPAVNDIVLRIRNNAPGGCGNDLALDDITFRPCGPQLTPAITGQTTLTADICDGDTRDFVVNCSVSAGFSNPVFQWQTRFNNGAWTDLPGATNTSLTVSFTAANSTGVYEYRMGVAEAGNIGSAQCRITSQPVIITIHNKPSASASSNSPVCTGTSLTLTAAGGNTYNWSGPAGFSAAGSTVLINNIQPAQAGLYTVLVRDNFGCSNIASADVIVNPKPTALVAFTDTSICLKDSVQIFVSGNGSYTWFPSTGLSAVNIPNPKASPATDTQYGAIVTAANGCNDTAYVQVRVITRAIAEAGPARTVIQNNSVQLLGSITGPYRSFSWSPSTDISSTTDLQPVVRPGTDRYYYLTAQTSNGCGSSTDSVFVKVFQNLYIPNAFSPNNDGKNDVWNIPALNAYPDFELAVYNRYGEVVFENRQTNKGWDGRYKSRVVSAGVYTYVIKLHVASQVITGTVLVLH